MKGWKAGLLGTLVVSLVLAAVAAIMAPQWLEEWNAERAADAKLYRQKGLDFGQQADTQQCMDKALAGLTGCLGNTCTINQGVFLKACFEVATPNPVLCEGIPPFRNKMLEKEKEWARYFCNDKNINHDGCRFMLRRQQMYCSGGVAADEVPAQSENAAAAE